MHDSTFPCDNHDVIVVGAGHAGCEAGLAAARMGLRTLVLTMNLDTIALMPCNPSIGGPAKGNLVREIDALGGEIGRTIDDAFIHIRTLNSGKGPAVQALRAQADKAAYHIRMKSALERQDNLDLKQAMVDGIIVEGREGSEGQEGRGSGGRRPLLPTQRYRVRGVVTSLGRKYLAKTVILTTGTSLAGRVIVGDAVFTSGRSGEAAATVLPVDLRELGLELIRLKTGTPPRIDARSIDFTKTEVVPGSPVPLHFSFWPDPEVDRGPFPAPNPAYPAAELSGWRPQMVCYLVHTNEATHEVIRSNLHRAPLFNGTIEGTGPRYCPSIEDKIVRFSHKECHQFFLEPEGWQTSEVYVQGANTSLPEEVQLEMLRTIPALGNAEIMRVGYAIEYDAVLPHQITAWLEAKPVAGLFLAGQINGTSGYEEAAGQGILAGINAALSVRGEEPLVLDRSTSYLGVMVDDLVTRDLSEPYRLLTSRAEHRLLLRQDTADERLTPLGYRLGLVSNERYQATMEKYQRVSREIERLSEIELFPSLQFNEQLSARGVEPISKPGTAAALLRRPGVEIGAVFGLLGLGGLSADEAEQVQIRLRYDAYIKKQLAEIERSRRMEQVRIPGEFDYSEVRGLSNEAREKLCRFRPAALGVASRIPGVTPADIALLTVALDRSRRLGIATPPAHQPC